MKQNNKKKGFTLVELVIVIAVIAILAGVMIATFSNVVEKANASKAFQEAKSRIDAAYINCLTEEKSVDYVSVGTDGSVVFYAEGNADVKSTEGVSFYKIAEVTEEKAIVVKLGTDDIYLYMTTDGYSVVEGIPEGFVGADSALDTSKVVEAMTFPSGESTPTT
jgi:prepilin peptidase-dependent